MDIPAIHDKFQLVYWWAVFFAGLLAITNTTGWFFYNWKKKKQRQIKTQDAITLIMGLYLLGSSLIPLILSGQTRPDFVSGAFAGAGGVFLALTGLAFLQQRSWRNNKKMDE